MKNLKKFILDKNKKKLFTPGPASLSFENIESLAPGFGRGDSEYQKVESRVLRKLKKMSKKKNIVRMQGSGSFAIEVMIANFLYGSVLILNSGYYSERLIQIAKNYKNSHKNIKKIKVLDWEKYKDIDRKYDWIIFCYTETSLGLKLPIKKIYEISKKYKSKIMLDATASFGLEKYHQYADVFSYSSCKGLFGLTGASFISYDQLPNNKIKSFNIDINSHLNKKMTGPYHAIYSLDLVLKNHSDFLYSVKINKKKFMKKFENILSIDKALQPLICTQVEKKVKTNSRNVILYKPRSNINGSIICHLGEVHLKRASKGNILNYIKF